MPIEVEVSADDKDARMARFNNRVALTVAMLASFAAFSAIQAGNVGEAREQAQAERNNSWAWYQAVRVREDMATYELAHLKRLDRGAPPEARPPLAAEIATQEGEIARIRARLEEVRTRAEAAETEHAGLSARDDLFDLSDALIAIAVTLLAVSTLARTLWLYGFALLPGAGGIAVGVAAILDMEPTMLTSPFG